MELELRFVPNAFKHGVTADEIWDVFLNQTVKCVVVKYKTSPPDTIYTAYGISDDGRYLEIGYVKETACRYRIIHAMDMRHTARSRFKKIRKL
ncbi:hypothetical protein GF339_12060 [candidate division KSB3 bacterium]|uniref:Toxin n=1 Tax=candidate division KSB3 bacterium TaxID=2044937 RepID=A0A9D5JW05_9BACT|nr:hypothetical protein [candidate division KSB3 bacterium]MBD3325314.1 hypothetical protein [candidate division KSB3 bacterium]